MPGIFINYRRDDAPGVAGRLYDHLGRNFARRDLFIDVDAVKPGLDFIKQLDAQISQCDVLLALIGPQWLDAKDEKGQRRLDSEKDYVRIEIAAALKRDIPVIPVLVHGADLPPEEELPDDLKSLTRRHALELRHARFSSDADALVAALKQSLPKRRGRWLWPLLAAACVAAIIGLAAALYPWTGQDAPSGATSEATAKPPIASPSAVEEARKRRLEALRLRQELATVTPGAGAKGPLRVEGVNAALGDSFDQVLAAYPAASRIAESSAETPPDLNLSQYGVRFFFSGDKTVRTIRMDPPFSGSAQGIRIGDSRETVLQRMGEPYTAPWNFGTNKAYAYEVDDAVVRYDIDTSDKVATIFLVGRRR